MQLVTVGPKHQVVIPKKVRQKLQIKPGDKVAIAANNKTTAIINTEAKNWTQRTRGIAKQAWEGINPIQELEKMRSQWQK